MADGVAIHLVRDGGGFAVSVQPPQPGHESPLTFTNYKAARGWAGGLRLVNCWPLVDHSEGGRDERS